MCDDAQNNTQPQNPTELGPQDREVLIRLIANEIQHNGIKVGIFAAEACQICGNVGTFSGLWHAMAVHVGPFQEFVCAKCLPSFDRELRGNAGSQLQQQPHRFCELCREQLIINTNLRFGHRWLCQSCLDAVRARCEWDSPEKFLGSLVRQRYVWFRFNSAEQLRAFHLRLEAMRLDMEETLAPNETERERLMATRSERAKAIIARYSCEKK